MVQPADTIRVNGDRLLSRLNALGEVGDTGDGGSSRLALTDDDRAGRDLVVTWMRDLGLDVRVDVVGNVLAQWGDPDVAPVLMGSHIDTVRSGGRYDGNLGVLAALEVIESVIEAQTATARPLAVAFFTDEEGARFAPDMLGSLTYAGGLAPEAAHDIRAVDGARLGDELARIGYLGPHPCPGPAPHAYVELHIEQGPILEAEGIDIGVVEGVQGICWQEMIFTGQANHAGTTPMGLRHDAGYAAASIAVFVRRLTEEMGPPLVATVGSLGLRPDLVNVVPGRATMTVDVRHTDELALREATQRVAAFSHEIALAEGLTVQVRSLADFEPVAFDPAVVSLVERTARRLGHSTRRLASGAGHDAQMLARMCPAGMIFVPSVGGISHNPAEYTAPEDLEKGANVLLHVALELAS
ncbi:MAG TPA: Zn-dependent hydrolase [Acidimicrobiales bacterium]|nr:Zn-dependent hydrolase [Acidimicrobiales bacterium]